jgi:hypothetical protein
MRPFPTLPPRASPPPPPAARQDLAAGDKLRDASGNPILKDFGIWLRSEMKKRFKDADMKYIDP